MDPDSIMPSEISQTEKDKLCFLKKQTKKLYSYKENRLMVASGTGWRVSKMDKTIQRYKPSVINNHRDITFSIVTTANNTVLHI